MILLHCECGTDSTVEDSFAGRAVRCPKCDRILHVPLPGQPGPERFKGFTRKFIGIFFGLVLLGTMAIPVARSQEGRIVWPFEMVSKLAELSGGWFSWPVAFFVGFWVAGGLLLLLGILLRKLPLALVYLVLACGMVVLVAGASQEKEKGQTVSNGRTFVTGELSQPFSEASKESTPLACPLLGVEAKYFWPVVALIGGFLALTSLRKKMGGHIPVCLLQIIVAGGLLALCIWSLVQLVPDCIDHVRKTGESYEKTMKALVEQGSNEEALEQVERSERYSLIGTYAIMTRPVYLAAGLALASLISLIHGLTFSRKSRAPAGWALSLSWLALIFWWLISAMVPVVIPLLINESPSREILFAVLPTTIFLLFAWSLAVVAVEAVSGLIADLAGAVGARPGWLAQPAAQTPVPPKPQPRQKPAGRTGVYRPPAPGPRPAPTPGQRLDQLKALREEGKITEEEYASRREDILKEL